MTKKDKSTQTIIFIALAFLLLLCLAKMPYGFYQVVRFLAFAGFGYSAYLQYKDKSIEAFRDIYVRAAHTLTEHQGQEDITIGRLRKSLHERKHLLKVMAGVFRRKK